ncbi:hypothetical protein [Streptococcus himalayensis]|uniref:Uncharacterized protein n=1 Tax=Streptococcus himalayensis TaxID=1888195 RepID=A0A917A777_9STRE|nr:hypothetical protein [Streptococcus himalayensis]GGE31279.1 hypothetical protein GCM10011510_10710 [Streptococcus himalayensis]
MIGADWIQALCALLSLPLTFLTIHITYRYEKKKAIFEERFRLYGLLVHKLQKLTANHEYLPILFPEVQGFIGEIYFFASDEINRLFQSFLDECHHESVRLENKNRSKEYNVFDVYIFTIIRSMKWEVKHRKDISRKQIDQIEQEEKQALGTFFVSESSVPLFPD